MGILDVFSKISSHFTSYKPLILLIAGLTIIVGKNSCVCSKKIKGITYFMAIGSLEDEEPRNQGGSENLP